MREKHPEEPEEVAGLGMEVTTAQAALPRSVDEIRADFPILAREFGGKQVVYLDSAATAQKPESVIEAINSYYRNSNANVHRSMHELAAEAEHLYEGGRAKVAGLVGRPLRARSCSSATRPRRSTSCATRGRASTSAPATWC